MFQFAARNEKGPAETAISPSHGSNTSTKGISRHGAAKHEGSTDADPNFSRVWEMDDALRQIGIIAFAASCAATENASRKGASDVFEISEGALNQVTAFLRAIEDIADRTRGQT